MNVHERKVLGLVHEALNVISATPSGGSASTTVGALSNYTRRASRVVPAAMGAISELRFGDPDRMAVEYANDAVREAHRDY